MRDRNNDVNTSIESHPCDNQTIINSPLRTFSIFGNADINVATNSIEKTSGLPGHERKSGVDASFGTAFSFLKRIFL